MTANEVSSRTGRSASNCRRYLQTCAGAKQSINQTHRNLESLASQAEKATHTTYQLSGPSAEREQDYGRDWRMLSKPIYWHWTQRLKKARAGEQGRGFAVVADEVKATSGRTSKATVQIKESIDTMLATIEGWQRHSYNREQTDACVQMHNGSSERLSEVETLMQSMNELMQSVESSAQ